AAQQVADPARNVGAGRNEQARRDRTSRAGIVHRLVAAASGEHAAVDRADVAVVAVDRRPGPTRPRAAGRLRVARIGGAAWRPVSHRLVGAAGRGLAAVQGAWVSVVAGDERPVATFARRARRRAVTGVVRPARRAVLD